MGTGCYLLFLYKSSISLGQTPQAVAYSKCSQPLEIDPIEPQNISVVIFQVRISVRYTYCKQMPRLGETVADYEITYSSFPMPHNLRELPAAL